MLAFVMATSISSPVQLLTSARLRRRCTTTAAAWPAKYASSSSVMSGAFSRDPPRIWLIASSSRGASK